MAGRGTDIVLGGNVEKQIQFIEANPDLSDAESRASARRCAMAGRRCTSKWWPLAACTSSAPSATNRAASTTSCVAVPAPGRPGMSRFFLSLDDPLLRIFAGDRVRAIMDRLKMPEGEPIEAGIVSRSIESAQRKVEARNFDIRKQLLEYDDVANDQRKVIYQQRNELLEATDISELIQSLRHGAFTDLVREYVPEESVEEQWDIKGLEAALAASGRSTCRCAPCWKRADLNDEDILNAVLAAADALYQSKVDIVGKESFGGFERNVMLQAWTATGANTWRRWTTCARVSTCAAMRRRIPSRNTSAKRSNCSARCWT
jgi:preprotein translocase subunit SecA